MVLVADLDTCEQLEQQWLILASQANSCAEQRLALEQAFDYGKKCSYRITADHRTVVLYQGLKYDENCKETK